MQLKSTSSYFFGQVQKWKTHNTEITTLTHLCDEKHNPSQHQPNPSQRKTSPIYNDEKYNSIVERIMNYNDSPLEYSDTQLRKADMELNRKFRVVDGKLVYKQQENESRQKKISPSEKWEKKTQIGRHV